MTLQPLDLDDLTWADIMVRVRDAIPAESEGLWTLHAPVDPGVTILELFAAGLEERLYVLDRIPDDLVRAILRLRDVEPGLAAMPATTVLVLEGAEGEVPAGTVLRATEATAAGPTIGEPELWVTTDADVSVLPRSAVRLIIDGVDRTGELTGATATGSGDGTLGVFGGAQTGRSRPGVDLLPAGGGPGRAAIVLETAQAPTEVPAGLSLAILLDVPGGVAAQWSPDAVDDVEPPAELRWTYLGPGDVEFAFEPGDIDDGTLGLRRSGIVRLPWPDEWHTPPNTAPPRFTIGVGVERSTFSSPPRVVGLHANAVTARHLRRLRSVDDPEVAAQLVDQIDGWLPLPDRELLIPETSGLLIDDVDAAVVDLVERDGVGHRWTAARDFAFAGPADRVFVIDRERGSLRFGDGLSGRIPTVGRDGTGAPLGIEIDYEVGAGEAANGGTALDWLPVAVGTGAPPSPPDVRAGNPVPLSGGTDTELVDAAAERAGRDLHHRYRAVTEDDHRTIATDVESLGVAIARVHVEVGHDPRHPCNWVPDAISLYLVPAVPVDPVSGASTVPAPQPDPGALTTVARHLEAARLLGSRIFVVGPSYRPVTVAVTVEGAVAALDEVTVTARSALARYLDPLVGDDGGGWPFGGPIRPSALLGVVQDELGSSVPIAAVSVGIDGAEPTESCNDVPLRSNELPELSGVVVQVIPRSNGGLR